MRDWIRGSQRSFGISGSMSLVFTRKLAFVDTLYQFGQDMLSPRKEVTDLFTFCPPGPEERLKVTSHILLGMLSTSNLASQSRVSAWSSSLGALECGPLEIPLRIISNEDRVGKLSKCLSMLYCESKQASIWSPQRAESVDLGMNDGTTNSMLSR